MLYFQRNKACNESIADWNCDGWIWKNKQLRYNRTIYWWSIKLDHILINNFLKLSILKILSSNPLEHWGNKNIVCRACNFQALLKYEFCLVSSSFIHYTFEDENACLYTDRLLGFMYKFIHAHTIQWCVMQ